MLKGIDVSRWQGAIDWAKVKPQTDFAYIKAGGADDVAPYTDAMVAGNATLARMAGVPFGFYWFYSGRNGVDAQLAKIASFRLSQPDGALPWVIDIEDGTRGADDILGGLKLAEAVAELTGVRPLIYTGAWWWNPRWDLARRMGAPEAVPFGLWVAAYTSEVIIPRGWSDWVIWQHTDTGRIDGIAGAVDLDHARAPFWDIPRELTMPKYEITATALNLRAEPNAASDRLADPLLPEGTIIEADAPVGGWHKVKLTNGQPVAGGVNFTPPAKYRVPDFGYISAAWTKLVESRPPPPPVLGLAPFGVNIQGDISAAYDAYAAGCRHFLFIDNFGAASEFMDRHPDATIHARRWGFRVGGSTQSMLDQLEGATDGRLVYEGPNEGDAGAEQNDPAGLAGRLRAEVQLARTIRRISGARYAAGAFSVGNPTGIASDPRVRAAIRTEFAPAYNAGEVWLCKHLYSPTEGHIYQDDDLQWYERRYEFWYGDDEAHCGLDPNIRNLVSSEGLIDRGSFGGALGCGLTEAQTEKVIRQTRIVHARPIVATWRGVRQSFPSPLAWWLIFCYGNAESWKTYNHQQWTEMLRRLWAEGG